MPRPKDQRDAKPRKNAESNSSSGGDTTDDEAIEFFIPGEGIDVEPLAFYIREYIDNQATIDPGRGQKVSRNGYVITAHWSISSAGLKDILNDSRDWRKEKDTRSYRRDPYHYTESDTAKRRRKNGPAPKRRVQVTKAKQEAESQVAPIDVARHGRPSVSAASGVAMGGEYNPNRMGPVDVSKIKSPATQPNQAVPRHQSRYNEPESGVRTVNIQNYNLSATTNYNPTPGGIQYARSPNVAAAKPGPEQNPPAYEPRPGKPRPQNPNPDGTYDRIYDALDQSKLPRPKQ